MNLKMININKNKKSTKICGGKKVREPTIQLENGHKTGRDTSSRRIHGWQISNGKFLFNIISH